MADALAIRPIRAVIFDWDGTLVDSIGSISACLAQAGRHCGFPDLEQSHYKQVIGLGLPQALRALWPGLSDHDVSALRDMYSELFVEVSNTIQWYEGAEALLRSLQYQGVRMGVATGKSRQGLTRAFGELSAQEYFTASRCSDETRSKPHPQMIEELLVALQVDKSEVIMVGDTTHDMLMASSANVRGLAVSWGAHSFEQLASVSPWMHVKSFEELGDFFATQY